MAILLNRCAVTESDKRTPGRVQDFRAGEKGFSDVIEPIDGASSRHRHEDVWHTGQSRHSAVDEVLFARNDFLWGRHGDSTRRAWNLGGLSRRRQ